MKIWKLIALLLLATCVAACDDDPKEEENGGNAGGSLTDQVNVGFGYDARTVLRNAGQVLVPVKLEKQVNNLVKVTVDAQKGDADTDAREGIDFNIAEKVVTVPVGDTLAYVAIDLLDNAKANDDRVITLNITGVYGGKTGVQKSCLVHILSNAFVEFEKTVWETWESAAGASASEAVRNTRMVPLVITGDLTEASTVVLGVVDSTASEPIHFTVAKEVTVQPGDSRVMVEISPIDDNDVNEDRVFTLFLKEVKGGNLCVGKTAQSCRVKILSEEVRRSLSFGITSVQKTDKEEELLIPVLLDKAPDGELTVKVAPVASSTAQPGKDYELLTPEVTIGNSRQAMVKVRIIGDNEVNAHRRLVLQFTEISDKSIFIDEKANALTLDIRDDDRPYFEASEIELVEATVGRVTILLPAVDRDRTMKLTYTEPTPGTWFETTQTVTVPANADRVEVPVNVKFTVAFPEVLPQLSMSVTEVDRFVIEEPVTVKVNLAMCAYRKVWGTYSLTSTFGVTSCDNITVSAGDTEEEILANFNKKLVCKGILIGGKNCTWHMDFDPVTQAMNVILHERLFPETVSFTAEGSCHVELAMYNDNATERIPVIMNEEYTQMKWNTTNYIGFQLEEAVGHYWSYLQNVVMTKK